MFRFDVENETDKRRLFALLLFLFSFVGFATWFFLQKNSESHSVQKIEQKPIQVSTHAQTLPTEPTPAEKEQTKQQAVEFVKAYASYDGRTPLAYLENSRSRCMKKRASIQGGKHWTRTHTLSLS